MNAAMYKGNHIYVLYAGHDMYLVLANFMVYKPALDLQEVPMFYLLVHSSGNQVSSHAHVCARACHACAHAHTHTHIHRVPY